MSNWLRARARKFQKLAKRLNQELTDARFSNARLRAKVMHLDPVYLYPQGAVWVDPYPAGPPEKR